MEVGHMLVPSLPMNGEDVKEAHCFCLFPQQVGAFAVRCQTKTLKIVKKAMKAMCRKEVPSVNLTFLCWHRNGVSLGAFHICCIVNMKS